MHRPSLLLLIAFCGGLALSQSAQAESRNRGLFGMQPSDLQGQLRQPSRGLSPSEAARQAQQQNGGGRVLGVDPAGDGYRVKLLKDGDVRVIFIPG